MTSREGGGFARPLALLLAAGATGWLAGCASQPPPQPQGDLYLTPSEHHPTLPSTDNDPNGGAN